MNTPNVPLSPLDIKDARAWVEHYLSDVMIALSIETVVSYRRKLHDFLSWWETNAPQRFCTDTLVKDYCQYRETQSRSSRTKYLHFTVLRHWGAYLVTKGRLDTNPWQKISAPQQPVHLSTGWLMLWEIKQLLKSFDQKKLSQHRDAVLCRIMLKTGARETELSLAGCY
jgi:site-specific recombinase XerD